MQPPPGSKRNKSSSKDKRRSGKEKSRRANSRSANDIESPEDTEKTRILADAGESDTPRFDTRALAEQLDDGGGQVHSSMARVKVISLRE